MNNSIFKINLDIHTTASQTFVNVKKADNGRKFVFALTENGKPYAISSDCTAVFRAKKPDGTILYNACTIADNTISYVLTTQTSACAGVAECEVTLYGATNRQITSPRFTMYVDETLYADDEVESEDEFTELTEAISSLETLESEVEDAEDERVEAEDERTEAEEGRVSAESNRASAELSRASAEESRVSAETSRTSAETTRANNESTRQSNETTRGNNETSRQTAESARVSNETARVSAESSRATAESGRVSAETSRSTAETNRVNAEASRVAAETSRQTEFATYLPIINAKQDALVSGTNIKTINNQSVLGSGNLDLGGVAQTITIDASQLIIVTAGVFINFTNEQAAVIESSDTVFYFVCEALSFHGYMYKNYKLTGDDDTYSIGLLCFAENGNTLYSIRYGNALKQGSVESVDYATEDYVDEKVPTVVQTTGTSTTDVMSQKAVTDELDELNNDLDDFRDSISQILVSENLFNKDNELVKSNKFIQGSGGYQNLSGSYVSHPINVESGKTYTFNVNTGYYGSNALVIRRCNQDGSLYDTSSGWAATDNGNGSASITFGEFTTVVYVCVNVRTPSSMMFVEGNTLPTEYKPYFEPHIEIKESVIPALPYVTNPLYGKKLALNGDSICYGAGYTGGYGKIIGENNNMTVSNIAVSGGTLATGTTYDGGGNRHWISATITNMPNDADYYIIEGGVNDASGLASLGTITNNYYDTLDTTKVLGALESICKTLQLTFRGKKYGFIFVHDVFAWTDTWDTTWKPAMKNALKKWGIPYLDLGECVPQIRNLDELRTYTVSSDGWHPTEEGYKKFYVPKIEAWLKTL